MRKIGFIIYCVLAVHVSYSQTFDEWFRQKETQIKYLLQQIAANQAYIEDLEKGYRIAQTGLQTINDIKHGDFNLHNAFFNSLRSVNPNIKNWAKVADIVTFQQQIMKEAKSAISHIKASGQFTPTEMSYLQHVFNNLLSECLKEINTLIDVIASGKTAMTDDERMRRINVIYVDMQDKLAYSKSFSSETAMLAMQRMQEAMDVEVSKKLNGLQ